MKPKFYDITPAISPKLAVFPGDQPFERRVAMSFGRGDHLELSSMLTTLHLGAHADAPSHYNPEGASIEGRSLGLYMGKAQVIRLTARPGERVRHLPQEVRAPRVLLDTCTFADPEQWRGDFASYAPELLNELADKGVRLVGIDTPSVDPADSKALESHQVLRARDLAVLEGLLLKDVPEDVYTLIALPLPIVGGDASPVRAVLLPYVPGFPDWA